MDDENFRLSLLAQILVLLQDLNCALNDKELISKSLHKIGSDQESWIGDVTKKAFYLISLHNCGKEYFRFLRSIFRHEKNWVSFYTKSTNIFIILFKDQLEE